ncbi:type II secretion system protein GspN [Desulfolithobacter sp.]
MRIVYRILVVAGYLLYGVVVLVLLLWWLFPAERARTSLEYRLQEAWPSLSWDVGAVGLQLPDRLVVQGVSVKDRESDKIEWLRVEGVQVRPAYVSSLRRQRPVFFYRLELLGGTVTGEVILGSSGGLAWSGKLSRLQVDGLKQLQELLGRQVSGLLSGQYNCQMRPTEKRLSRLRGHFYFFLEDGSVSMREPVLGHKAFPFQRMEVSLEQRGRDLVVRDGKVLSRLLRATFSGTVQLRPQLAASTLKLHGIIIPLPELLAGLRDDAATASVRERLQQGEFPFGVKGTLLEPAIRFPASPNPPKTLEVQR